MARIGAYDEASLGWYFGEGQACFERSTMGAMLDRVSLYGIQHVPCPEMVVLCREREPWEAPPDALTARPRATKEQASGYTPDEMALSRYARVSRRLRAVAALDTLAAAVLSAYYGDQGARWGRTPQGRVFALAPLTVAGLELVRRANANHTVRLGTNANEQIEAEVKVQAVQPAKGRAHLVEKARREGLALYDRACEVWQQTGVAQCPNVGGRAHG